MIDYTLTKSFWERLHDFIKNVRINDPMSEEEKDMILHICDLKLSKKFYCQNHIEGKKKCKTQCEHCKEYYKPLEK